MEENKRKPKKKEVKNVKEGTSKKTINNQPKKTMRKSEKRLILILVIITIIVTAIYFVVKNKTNELDGNNNNTEIQNQSQENISILEDGTKLNISNKIKETKKIDGLEFTDMEITEKDNVTVILANIKNTTNEIKGNYPINIKVVDKDSKEIITISGYIGEVKPNQSITFNASATFDFSNAYDIIITKKY
ncbi:MAG: hypothetical protein ACLVA2_07700 [Clostridia bacterium]